MDATAHHVGVADILRRFGPAYRTTHALSAPRAKVWRALVACRTAALGGHLEACDSCGSMRLVYHSCRNRHCPLCQTRAKEAWLAQRQRELLPVPYFHLVFTLPHDLNWLIGQQPRAIYDVLFAAVSATLTEFAANPRWLGGTTAFSLILHTWKQDLGRHVHLHALVAGGALAADGQWIAARRGFLFPVHALSRVFRGKFVAALAQARATTLHEVAALADAPWRVLRARLHKHAWVVYAKQPLGGPEQVLAYLGRYTHRVAISNERIVAIDGDEVVFRVRADPTSGKKRSVRLDGATFIARFLLHVLPSGFKRIRHYGLLAAKHKAQRLAAARLALAAPPPDPVVIESVAQFMQRVAHIDATACAHCGKGHFVAIEALLPLPASASSARGPPCV